MEDNNTVNGPTPCTAGCGFYGSKIYNQMCSKCFKEQEQHSKQELPASTMTQLLGAQVLDVPSAKVEHIEHVDPSEHDAIEPIHTTHPTELIEQVEQEEENKRPTQKSKGRCFTCHLKIPLAKQLSNKCRCDYVFCDSHRYPDKHQCDFDHATMDKGILAKNNPRLNDKPRGGRSFQRLDSL
ncbi:hypothetical protein BDF14DRAFT_1857320 [Spinellus fusiger]|nr:hypothetical protein BDF14DRAFT_1857320 [Spinellus fusiger]